MLSGIKIMNKKRNQDYCKSYTEKENYLVMHDRSEINIDYGVEIEMVLALDEHMTSLIWLMTILIHLVLIR